MTFHTFELFSAVMNRILQGSTVAWVILLVPAIVLVERWWAWLLGWLALLGTAQFLLDSCSPVETLYANTPAGRAAMEAGYGIGMDCVVPMPFHLVVSVAVAIGLAALPVLVVRDALEDLQHRRLLKKRRAETP